MPHPDAPLAFASIESCIQTFAAGNFLIVLDDDTRENEGDLIIAAAALTPAKAAFMIRHTSGYLCAPLSPSRAKSLHLHPMVPQDKNADPNGTAYTITVDAVPGALHGHETQRDFTFPAGPDTAPWGVGALRDRVDTTTGISASDRSRTCNVLAHPAARATDLRRPGHVVPLLARPGGVRERRGHTEAGWEFCRLAGLVPEVAVIGELVEEEEQDQVLPAVAARAESNAVGMMRAEACLDFGKRWGIPCCTIKDLVSYVEDREAKPKVNGASS